MEMGKEKVAGRQREAGIKTRGRKREGEVKARRNKLAKLEKLRRGVKERGSSRGRLGQELAVKSRDRRQRKGKYITADEGKGPFGDQKHQNKKKEREVQDRALYKRQKKRMEEQPRKEKDCKHVEAEVDCRLEAKKTSTSIWSKVCVQGHCHS